MYHTAFEELSASGCSIYDGPYYEGDQLVGLRQIPEVGHRVGLRDGREFIFVRVPEADISQGAPVCIQLSDNAAFNTKLDVDAAESAGSLTIDIDTTGIDVEGAGAGIIVAGYFAGGKLTIPTGAAAGVYGIIQSEAGTGAVAITLTLDRPLKGAVTISSKAFLTRFDYHHATVYAAASPVVIGFAVNAFTASTNSRVEYGWIQVRGVGGVKIKTVTSIALGSSLVLGDSAGLILEAAHAAQPLATALTVAAQMTAGDVVPALIHV
jgi:hypothetical protein